MHSLLAEIVTKKKWQSRFELHQVFERWQALVGTEISRHAVPSRYRGKVLWVDVSDAVWHQQLQFLKHDLLTKLNRSLPKECIEDIRFQLAKTGADFFQDETPLYTPPKTEPAPEESSAMDRLLESVEDKELRQAMKRCWHDFYSLPKK